MSSSILFGLNPGEHQVELVEFRNSHGTAFLAWGAMAKRYLGMENPYYPRPGWINNMDEVCALWRRTDIPVEHRAVLMLTFDGAYVKRDYFREFSASARKFWTDFPTPPHVVNHWQAVASAFDGFGDDYAGVGLQCTTVSDSDYLGEYDEERDEWTPPKWDSLLDIYADLYPTKELT